MDNSSIQFELAKDFENIQRISPKGTEYWIGRELMPLLGYKNWRDFRNAINRAKIACEQSNQVVENHFEGVLKIAKIGSNNQEITRKIDDYFRRITIIEKFNI